MNRNKKIIVVAAVLLLILWAAVAALVSRNVLVISLAALSLLSFAGLVFIRRVLVQVLLFNFAALCLILSVFEVYYLHKEDVVAAYAKSVEVKGAWENILKDDIVGSRPSPGSRRVFKRVGEEVIYDVNVTIGENGLRITPPCSGRCDTSVLFFGDSFTFGEGVNDEQTLPWYLGLLTHRQYRLYNFAFSGYGTHQMLSAIDHGMIEELVEGYPRYIIYQAIYPEHVYRLKGTRSWDAHGPRYLPDMHGLPVFSGHFDDDSLPASGKSGLLHAFALGRRIAAPLEQIDAHDKDLFVAMILQSKHLLNQKFPLAEFHIILWDWTEGGDKKWFQQLTDQGIFLHSINDILPDKDMSNLVYKISEHDKHPNPWTHMCIAKYVNARIIH
jgi:hypothetical protein